MFQTTWRIETWRADSLSHILQNMKIWKQHLARNDIIIMVNQAVWSIKLIELLFLFVRSEFDGPNGLVYQATLLPETVAKFGPQRNQANYTIIS